MKWFFPLLVLVFLLPGAVPAQARKTEAYLQAAYGNQREEFSVRRAGDLPAVFVPTGITSLAWYDRFLYIPDGLKFVIKKYDHFGKLVQEIPLDKVIRDEGAILFGDLQVDSAEILLTDTIRGVLWIIDRTGKMKNRVETRSLNPDCRTPDRIFRDRSGRIWIHDRNTRRMLVTAPGNPQQLEQVLHRMDHPTVLPEGMLVTCHRELNNRRCTISILDRNGRFMVPLQQFTEEEAMGPVHCLGTDVRGNFHFIYHLRGGVVIRMVSPSGRAMERSLVPGGLSLLLLVRPAVLDATAGILHLVPGKDGVTVMRYGD